MEYQYQAVNSQGETVSGHIDADTERAALGQLQRQGLTPVRLEQQNLTASNPRFSLRPKKIGAQDKALVIRELGTLLQAGVSLAEAISSMAQSHGEEPLGRAFGRMYGALRGGGAFTVALRDSGVEWPPYLHQLAAAGEQTGKLAIALHGAADQMEYEEKVREEMRNALIYPAVLVVSGIAATLLVFLVVVPKFSSLLKSSRAQLPEISVWVLKTGLFVKEHIEIVGLVIAGLILFLIALFRNPAIRAQSLEILARTPLLGPWLNETEMGRWAAMLSALLDNRVPILKAMELAENSLRLTSLRLRLRQSLADVRAGKKIADALAATRLLNVTGLNLIRVGERSGELPRMLRTLAQLYENAGRQRLKRFLILLEPAAILLIGGVIGFIMVAIMMAITSLSNIAL